MPNPIEKASKIPNVIDIYVKAPAGPFTSIGDTSAIYFGQKTEKAPTETLHLQHMERNRDGTKMSKSIKL